MKIKVTVELEIPDVVDDNVDLKSEYTKGITWEMAHVIQDVFDNFLNYATTSHLQDVIEWIVESKGDEASTEYQIVKHHQKWADILSGAERTMKVERIDG
jgi:hypothetical protein